MYLCNKHFYMNFDLTEIGGINCTLNFDEDWYEDYLSANDIRHSEEALEQYVRDECDYDVEFLDSETFHRIGYETMTIAEIENEFGEKIAEDIFKDCMDGKEHSYETLEYMNDEVDINNPSELASAAMKYLRSGEYSKNCRGFILSNGVVVYTDAEHSMCTRIPGIKSTFHFIELGNVRVLDHSIDIAVRPNGKQVSTLEEVLNSYYGEELYLDLCNKSIGHVSIKYNRCEPRTVLNDISKYFSGQLKDNYIVRENKKARR